MPNLTQCKDCGHQVSKRAKTCPSCGVKNPANRTSPLTVFVVFVLIMWFFAGEIIDSYDDQQGFSSSQADVPERVSPTRRESSARLVAEREIKKQLKSPSTADFSGYSDTQIGNLRGRGEDVWIDKGYVDSQNSFGAMLRNKYEVVIVFEAGKNDSYKVESADLWES
jgi:hypothetical protein